MQGASLPFLTYHCLYPRASQLSSYTYPQAQVPDTFPVLINLTYFPPPWLTGPSQGRNCLLPLGTETHYSPQPTLKRPRATAIVLAEQWDFTDAHQRQEMHH